MPRTCTICDHPECDAIDHDLAGGGAYPALAAKYGVSPDALRRHKHKHLPAALARAQEAADVAHGDDLLAQVRDLQAKALRILAAAEAAGELRTALAAIREARGNLELLAKLLGELQQEGTVNLVVAPEWIHLRATILQAVSPYPEAARAIAEAICDPPSR